MRLLCDTKIFPSKNYEMKDLGEASYELGIYIHRDQHQNIFRLSQKSYIKKILKRFGIEECKSLHTLVIKGDNLVSISSLKMIK